MPDWKENARDYFFESHLNINEISVLLGKSRQSVSTFLKGQPGYKEEKENRKAGNMEKRKEYQRAKNREYRNNAKGMVTAETLKREHEIAVMLLSHEKY